MELLYTLLFMSSQFQLKEIKGDVFTSSHCLVHCVSQDLKMGKGIATLFKSRFGGLDLLTEQKKKVGDVAVLEFKESNPRFVYYLITKEKYWGKPTYQSLRNSLVNLQKHMLANRVQSLAMPRLGCGLDQLDWNKVKIMITEVFQNQDVCLDVYSL